MIDKKHVEALAFMSMVDEKHNVEIVEVVPLVSMVDEKHIASYVQIVLFKREQ